jgi:hypothetical protein
MELHSELNTKVLSQELTAEINNLITLHYMKSLSKIEQNNKIYKETFEELQELTFVKHMTTKNNQLQQSVNDLSSQLSILREHNEKQNISLEIKEQNVNLEPTVNTIENNIIKTNIIDEDNIFNLYGSEVINNDLQVTHHLASKDDSIHQPLSQQIHNDPFDLTRYNSEDTDDEDAINADGEDESDDESEDEDTMNADGEEESDDEDAINADGDDESDDESEDENAINADGEEESEDAEATEEDTVSDEDDEDSPTRIKLRNIFYSVSEKHFEKTYSHHWSEEKERLLRNIFITYFDDNSIDDHHVLKRIKYAEEFVTKTWGSDCNNTGDSYEQMYLALHFLEHSNQFDRRRPCDICLTVHNDDAYKVANDDNSEVVRVFANDDALIQNGTVTELRARVAELGQIPSVVHGDDEDTVNADGEDESEDEDTVNANGEDESEDEDTVNADGEDESEDEDTVNANGEDESEDEDTVNADGEDESEDEDTVNANGEDESEDEDTVNANGEDESEDEDEDTVNADGEDESEEEDTVNADGEKDSESESEDEIELSEIKINGLLYYTDDSTNGILYGIEPNGDIGDQIGFIKNNVSFFS